MLALVLRGFVQRKLRVLLTGDRDRARRRADGRHLHPHRHDQPLLRGDLPDREQGPRRRRHARPKRSAAKPARRPRRSPKRCSHRCARRPASPKRPARSSRRRRSWTRKRKRLTSGGAPAFIASDGARRASSPSSRSQGRFPRPPDEVAIDEATAKRAGPAARPADDRRRHRRRPGRYTIVGILKFGGGESFGGAGAALLIPAEAQRVLGEPGRFDQIDVAAAAGRHARTSCATASAPRCRATVDVRTGAEQASQGHLGPRTQPRLPAHLPADLRLRRARRRRVHHLQHLLDHRRPAHARVRRCCARSAPRAARSCARSSTKACCSACSAPCSGCSAGSRWRRRSNALFKAFGADLPDIGTVLETRTIVVSLLVGIVVTVLAGLPPALRATRVPPLAAMREGVRDPAAAAADAPRAHRPLRARPASRSWCSDRRSAARRADPADRVRARRRVGCWARLRRGGERPPRRYRVVPALGARDRRARRAGAGSPAGWPRRTRSASPGARWSPRRR